MIPCIPNDYALANHLIRFYGLRYTKEFTIESINLYMFYFLVRICKEYKIKNLQFCNDIIFKEDGPLFDRFHFTDKTQLVPIDSETGFFIYNSENITKEYVDLTAKSFNPFRRVFKNKDYERILHELIKVPEEDLISCYKKDLAVKTIRSEKLSLSYQDVSTFVEDFTVFQLPEKLANIILTEVVVNKYNINLNSGQKILIQKD